MRLPADRPSLVLAAFVTWTFLVWTSRVRNVLADPDLSAAGTAWRLAAAAAFVVGAVAVAVVWWRRGRAATAPVVGALAAWTVVWWVIRGGGILVDDHDAGFKVIHTVLAVVSIGLAVAAWRLVSGTTPRRTPVGAGLRGTGADELG